MTRYRLGVIGAGNMGGAVIDGAMDAGVLSPGDLLIMDPGEDVRARYADRGCGTTAGPLDPSRCDVLMIAVKPQVFPQVASSLGAFTSSTVVISVMAGLSSGTIRRALGDHARIVRVMPNTPARRGAGVSAIALGEGAVRGDESFARSLFDAVGTTVIVDESMMYAVTAVSGSGPAYVFLLAEAMLRSARELGLPDDVAQTLVASTICGAGVLLSTGPDDPSALRRAVTSPGGTTAAAIEVMQSRGLESIVVDAITAARDRGIELDTPG